VRAAGRNLPIDLRTNGLSISYSPLSLPKFQRRDDACRHVYL
jgi:hypothetical protein